MARKRTMAVSRRGAHPASTVITLGLLGAVIASVWTVSTLINRTVPEPYLDEIFHIPQAQKYCDGKWREWDDKITTGPGLYAYSVGLIRLLTRILPQTTYTSLFTSTPICTPQALRLTNLFLLPITAGIFHLISAKSWFECIVISLFPLHFFFHFLYYTDALSTMLTLAAIACTRKKAWWLSGILVAFATMTRQTNIVWGTAIAMGGALITDLGSKQQIQNPAISNASVKDVAKAIGSIILVTLRDLDETLYIVGPFILLVLGFGTFVVQNGGSLVLGDKSNHQSGLHFPQLLYFAAFAAIWSAPVALLGIARWRRVIRWPVQSASNIAVTISVFALTQILVHYFTYEHPFLLADNRHYVFYLWQRTYRRFPHIKYLLVPGYMLAAGLIFDAYTLAGQRDVLSVIIYVSALAATLIPSPLIEPRYFILPYLLYRLGLPRQPQWKLLLEALFYSAVNVATVYIFLERPFEWKGTDGLQRFMW